jgi:hypothetical protein
MIWALAFVAILSIWFLAKQSRGSGDNLSDPLSKTRSGHNASRFEKYALDKRYYSQVKKSPKKGKSKKSKKTS